MALPAKLAAPVIALIGHMGSWPARPIQQAAAATYSDPIKLESYFEDLDSRISDRMEILFKNLSNMRDSGLPVEFIPPQGGIYLSTRFNLFGALGVNTNEEIRLWLLNEAGIAVIPFQSFGLEDESGWFRISIGAVSVEEVSEAMIRLENALRVLFLPNGDYSSSRE